LGGCAGSESTYFFTQRPTDCPLTCRMRAALRWLEQLVVVRSGVSGGYALSTLNLV